MRQESVESLRKRSTRLAKDDDELVPFDPSGSVGDRVGQTTMDSTSSPEIDGELDGVHCVDTAAKNSHETNAETAECSYRKTHPLTEANIFSQILFCWMVPLFRRGYQKTLQAGDLFKVLPDDSSKVLVEKLQRNWNKELEKSRTTGKSPSLLRALTKTFAWRFMLYGLPAFLEEVVFKVAQPLFLSRLLLYFSTDLVSLTEAYLCAAAIALCAVGGNLICHHITFFGSARMGMRVRVACSSLVYRKSLKLSNLALKETTIGQLVNILSNDVNRFDLALIFLHYLWIGPIQFFLIAGLVWREIGVSSLAGLSILLLMAPIQGYMAKLFSKFRSKTALLSDKRIRIMNEVISGMHVIKVYAWEMSFGQLVSEARQKEIHKIMQAAYLRVVTLTFFFVAPLLIMLSTFWVYAALGNPVTPPKVYAVLPLYYAGRICLALFMPFAVMNGMEGLVSIRRIKEFLLMEELITEDNPAIDVALVPNVKFKTSAIELNDLAVTTTHDVGTVPASEGSLDRIDSEEIPDSPLPTTTFLDSEEKPSALPVSLLIGQTEANRSITVEHLSGSWTKDINSRVLEDISFSVEPGELLAVIGPVGCGKSSLLMALLGELPSVCGGQELPRPVGYTAQQPWILTGSLRSNILFGSVYQPARYQIVISRCALAKDIALLPNGDQTLVGERGVTLSGGQRARVSLARAVYSEADAYLFDDPLSAVDPAVGRHLFEKCILHYLDDKPRILVTHQLQFLDQADKILILKQGKVAGYGTYQELQELGVDFGALLKKKEEAGDFEANQEEEKPSLLSRQLSSASRNSLSSSVPEFEVEVPLSVAPEEIGTGSVGVRNYIRYFRAGAGAVVLAFWFVLSLGAQVLYGYTDLWLAWWANAEEADLVMRNLTEEDDWDDAVFEDQSYYIFILAILSGLTVVLCFIRNLLFFYIFVTAAKNLHNQMFASVIRAPMQFFDTNPVGRVLNRFAKDIGYMDELLPSTFTDFLQIMILTFAVVIIISIFNPFCLVFTLPLCVVFVLVRKYYLSTSRDVKRLEGNARSPVFSHLSATLTGLSTIRAFKSEQRFVSEFDEYQDRHTETWFVFLATSRWFGIQLDIISMVFVVVVSFSSLIAADLLGLNSGIVGLSLTYAINLMGSFQWGVRQSAEVENQMTSVERVCQYVDIEPEAALVTDKKPPPDWPKYGLITLEAVSLRYSEKAPLVLKRIFCCIQSKEKVGIVGRTGAGKSSLMTILMRLTEPTGTIMVDGIDIAQIGLHDLRRKISFIPQDPVLFSGTLRTNLDPFCKHSDPDIWRALEEVELKPTVKELPKQLEAILTEGGTNFSVGQRQLLCLSRAILRKNRILIVDEATANVDVRTDRLIQATIRDCFQHCTVLTIAHRLNTVMDSDRVMVLEEGRLLEFDEPYILLQKENGMFASMVRETGRAEVAKLMEIAKDKYLQRNPSDPYRITTESVQMHGSRHPISIETSL